MSKFEERIGMLQTLIDATDRLPRLLELFGTALFAGRASERLGGKFVDGAIGGMVADGLAHSNLPNNQVGGIALGTYFAGLGLLTVAPVDFGGFFGPDAEVKAPRLTTVLTREECDAQGGVWIEGILGGGCRLPQEGGGW